ncbi:MAG: hypothetical protein M3M86_06005 [Thermoproteota archaeon]|nr:hypothetical protein [Thermoproteota archaeon]
MHTSTSSRKTKSTYAIIIILATLLVLSGAGVTLYPTQAFADGEKDKPHDDKHGKDKPHDDKHKKPEDDKDKLLKAYIESVIAGDKEKQDKLLKAYIESITAGIKDEHKSDPKKDEHKSESVTATTEPATATTESEEPKKDEEKKSEEPKEEEKKTSEEPKK